MRANLMLVAVAVLLAACGGQAGQEAQPRDTSTAGGTAEVGPAADCIDTSDITAVDNDFEPICVIAASGAELSVTNEGGLSHTFTIRDTDVDEVLEPGDEATVTVPDTLETEAESEFHCRFHPSMVGYLYVTEA
jgi:plastocyanin